jgi:hypothetical protein
MISFSGLSFASLHAGVSKRSAMRLARRTRSKDVPFLRQISDDVKHPPLDRVIGVDVGDYDHELLHGASHKPLCARDNRVLVVLLASLRGPAARTLQLFEDVVEVVLQTIFLRDQHAEPILLDACEGLRRIDAPLVEDAKMVVD